MFRRSFLAMTIAATSFTPSFAADLKVPTDDVLLTVTGDIGNTNTDNAAVFDLAMLKALPSQTFETTTVWTEGPQQFEGVTLNALLNAIEASGATLIASAINDYAVEIPVSDAVENGPILAYHLNGETMSVRNKGPLWIVYPYDQDTTYQTETIYARSIWQLDRIEVSD